MLNEECLRVLMTIEAPQQKAVLNFVRECVFIEGDMKGVCEAAVASIKRSDVLVQLTDYQTKRKNKSHRSVVMRQPMELIEVIKACDAAGDDLSDILKGCKNLAEVEVKVRQHAAEKTAVKVDADLKEKVLKLARKQPLAFQLAYDAIHKTALELALTSKEYFVQPMQTYMAAWCATTHHQHAIIMAAPAEGKTYVFLHFLNKVIMADASR